MSLKRFDHLPLPRSLQGQFRLVLLIQALLIITGAFAAIYGFHVSSVATRRIANRHLTLLQQSQDLVQSALLIERQAYRILNADSINSMQASYVDILNRLDQLDASVLRLGRASNDLKVLALNQGNQLFRNTLHTVAQLQRNLLAEKFIQAELTRQKKIFNQLSDELHRQVLFIVGSSRDLSAKLTSDHKETMRQLNTTAAKGRTWVIALLSSSVFLAWLVSRYFLGYRILTRLQHMSNCLCADKAWTNEVFDLVHGDDEIGAMANAINQFFEDRRLLIETQHSLKKNEELLTAIIEAAPVAILGVDLDGNVHSVWNRAAEEMFGWRADEVMGKPLPMVQADKADEFRRFREQIRKGMTLDGIEVQRQRRDGTLIDYTLYASPMRDLDGNITGNIAVLVDTSERKKMELELRRREQYQRVLLDNFPFLVWLKDKESRLLAANLEYAHALGWTFTAELEGKTDFDFFPDELAQKYVAEDRAVMAAKKPKNVEEEYVDKHGERHWMETWKAPLTVDEEVVGTVGFSRDITARMLRTQALRQSEIRLQDIINCTSDWIWEADINGFYTFCSGRIEKVLGYKPEELKGKNLFDLMLPEEANRLSEIFKGHIAKKESIVNVENWNVTKDGRKVCLLTNGVPVLDEKGDLIGYRGADQDITDRKILEEKIQLKNRDLERSNTELGQFAYVASHDLQEPLRKVGSYMEIIADRYGGKLDQDAREFIHYAVDGARRMKTMIDDLLVYSRVGTQGKIFVPVDMMDVMKTVLDDLELLIWENEARISYDFLPMVSGDGSQLQQLFRNLIGNAIKYRRKASPLIRIWAEQDKKYWKIFIQDNGIGIDPRFYARIFQIFQRLHSVDQYSGTGIGLAVCKKIVERHGGTIGLESVPETGSTFSFTIPISRKDNLHE